MNPRERGQKLVDALVGGQDGEALKFLKDKVDFSIVNKGDNAIHLAARRGQLKVIEQMKTLGADLQQKNLHGNVAMHYAAKGGYLDLVRFLKANGAKLNIKNQDGESPLHEAVKTQTMDMIEALVDLGMDPNCKNDKTGETPLHTALKYGAEEAMEGLLIKGAKSGTTNNDGKKAEDVAKTAKIRESLRMYSTMLIAMSAGYIKAKGQKITLKDVSKPLKIDRVGVIIDKIDIPKEFPTGFYCRRERGENSVVTLKNYTDESIYSDVFHIRIYEVNRDCTAKLKLPLYRPPSDKEELVIRFINSGKPDVTLNEWETLERIHYCLLETTLVPETTCICVVYLRQKKEDNKITITDQGTTITSEIEKNFTLDVPPGSFEAETVLSLTVFETNSEDYEESEDSDSVNTSPVPSKEVQASPGAKVKRPNKEKATETNKDDNSELGSKGSLQKTYNANLLTDVYQINIIGQQPKKGITVKIPFCKGSETTEDVVIVRADEKTVHDENNENALEVLPVKPKVVGMNLIFEVSHFSIYVASWKKKTSAKEELQELQRQIASTRGRQKPATFFAVVKLVEDRKHVLVVECVVASRSIEHRRKWIENDEYQEQNPPETGAMMMTPGDTFYVNVEGNASLEDKADAEERKIQFSLCRSSWQPYHVILHENIYEQDKAFGYVSISKKTDTGLEEAVRLRIKLTPPPPPPPPPRTPLTDNDRLRDMAKRIVKQDAINYEVIPGSRFIAPVDGFNHVQHNRTVPPSSQQHVANPVIQVTPKHKSKTPDGPSASSKKIISQKHR